MNTVNTVAAFILPFWEVIGPPLALYLLHLGMQELRRRGYSATYTGALERAVGDGFAEVQQAGVDPFSAAGRAMLLEQGVEYLKAHVGEAATALGILTDADHMARVVAQLGAMEAAAKAGLSGPIGLALKMLATPSVTVKATNKVTDAVANVMGGLSNGPGMVVSGIPRATS